MILFGQIIPPVQNIPVWKLKRIRFWIKSTKNSDRKQKKLFCSETQTNCLRKPRRIRIGSPKVFGLDAQNISIQKPKMIQKSKRIYFEISREFFSEILLKTQNNSIRKPVPYGSPKAFFSKVKMIPFREPKRIQFGSPKNFIWKPKRIIFGRQKGFWIESTQHSVQKTIPFRSPKNIFESLKVLGSEAQTCSVWKPNMISFSPK